jgi:hypothetical protein
MQNAPSIPNPNSKLHAQQVTSATVKMYGFRVIDASLFILFLDRYKISEYNFPARTTNGVNSQANEETGANELNNPPSLEAAR